MNHKFSKSIPVFVVAATFMAGCASNPESLNAGERLSARGQAVSAKGAAWADGKHNVDKGNKLVARSASHTIAGEKKLKRAQESAEAAQREIQTAQTDRTDGEKLIAGGTTQMQDAETSYAAIHNGPAAIKPQ